MIGTKTIAAVLLTALVAVAVGLLLSPARVAALDSATLFWFGLWASVAGPLTVRFVRADRRSQHGLTYSHELEAWDDGADILRVGHHRIALLESDDEAFDLPRFVQYGVYVVLAFVVGLLTIDSRAIAIIAELPSQVISLGSPSCPDPAEQTEAARAKESPGCALLRRAYELGYAEDLGSCELEIEALEQVCTGRQHDEPLLHYAWRLLRDFWASGEWPDIREEVAALSRSVVDRVERLDTVVAAQSHLMGSGPRAAHHIWTNLPHPEGGLRDATGDTWDPNRCVGRFQRMAHRPTFTGERNVSVMFEHVLGKLLFEPRYAPPVAACRELTIHWGSSTDVCARVDSLAPELTDVRAVVARLEESQRLAGVESAGREGASDPRWHLPRYLSFSCFVVEERATPARTVHTVDLGGHEVRVNQVRVNQVFDLERSHIEWYGLIATLLARGFHYGALMSQAGMLPEAEEGIGEELFRGRRFSLARLDYLNDMDIFLGNEWLLDREDLREVYPYHVHLRNFVETFRRQYKSERGRL